MYEKIVKRNETLGLSNTKAVNKKKKVQQQQSEFVYLSTGSMSFHIYSILILISPQQYLFAMYYNHFDDII